MSSNCICQDDNLTMQINCFRCKTKFNRKKELHEKMSECPLHNNNIAICSSSCDLCENCIKEGYLIMPRFGFEPPQIYKDE